MPALFEKKKDKFTILISIKPLGNAIFAASKTSPLTEGSIIYSAAKVIRKHMFEQDEVFVGVSKERQKKSVSRHLLLLLGLILEGSKNREESKMTADLSLQLAHN